MVREIILPESKYRRFQADLLAEAPFIAARTQLTGYSEKSGRFRCLLVTTRRRQDGILIDSEGYAYRCRRFSGWLGCRGMPKIAEYLCRTHSGARPSVPKEVVAIGEFVSADRFACWSSSISKTLLVE